MTEKDIEATFRETEYILRRWEFGVSCAGLLWIRPLLPQFTPEELAAVLQLLADACDTNEPGMIRLDLSNSRVVGEQWTLIEGLVADFARRIDAVVRMAQGTGCPASSILFCRKAAGTGKSPGADNLN